ncbi:DUF1003 domain-containing protein [Brachybacterium aquaticum]|uniref:Putative membrane protein n=1 Tax=Brachybacterium aquaticum TaxID=1432564 RepID=A0A841AEC1_9MICO|nr:DUF1003 domain-containing protein [Brachybacterium aquaticum]MBB5831941.1 putative membrane protein [Brachybacterium aquaticum]
MAEQKPDALDDPAPRRGRLRNPFSGDAFGRAAEGFARMMGTPAFLVGMTLFCAIWLTWNSLAPESAQFDPRALNFTLLTLILSLQASYAAPLLLLAQNRQDDRDRVQNEQDRQSNERNHATTDFITREIASLRLALNDVATRDFVRGELRDLLEDLEEARQQDAEAAQAEAAQLEAAQAGGSESLSLPSSSRGAQAREAQEAQGSQQAPAPSLEVEALRALLREEVEAALDRRERRGPAEGIRSEQHTEPHPTEHHHVKEQDPQ